MNGYKTITENLHRFTKKYYTSELIKGCILFFSLGFLYFLLTLFLEYFLWLEPTARKLLVFFFVLVEIFLLSRFIAIPVFKLIGLRKGISIENAAKIIGRHFPEVKDKLLNVIQLNSADNQSDLLLASIHQKSEELRSVPFVNAVAFKKNLKYLKLTTIPVLIWLLVLFSGNSEVFTKSLDRVVNYNLAYSPPAPFYFSLENTKLQVIQGGSFNVLIKATGKVFPAEVKIIFDNQSYYTQNSGKGSFTYLFTDIQKPTSFYLEGNGIKSSAYLISVVNTPSINRVSLGLKYPFYLGKKEELLQNSGNTIVPEGTSITWRVATSQTEEVVFIQNQDRSVFKKMTPGNYEFVKEMESSLTYQIAASNTQIQDYEVLQFSVGVTKDEAPKIKIQTNSNSVPADITDFAIQVSDDYGLQKLQVVYYRKNDPQVVETQILEISEANIQTLFYQFPNELLLDKGVEYALFFEVYDNDGVNGSKKTKSDVYRHRQKTEAEIEEERLQEQRSTINRLESTVQKQKKQEQKLTKIQQDLQRKKTVNWNDKKRVADYIKRQEQFKKTLQQEVEKLQNNLGDVKKESELLQSKKEDLKKRILEIKKTDKQKKLLAEIEKLAKKLNKEGLVQKAKELAQQNKQQERSLERILELVKRFYIEQKTMQIANKLKLLAKDQKLLELKDGDVLEAQDKIQKEFEGIKKQLGELAKDNEKLKDPMDLPDVEEEKELITNELDRVEENLQKDEKAAAKKNQRKSANKMEEMSAKMQKAMMEMEAESTEENMEDIRKVLENLIVFSFKQEKIMEKFKTISTEHPDFGKDLKDQNGIRTYFEHIDDSLYVLSMRLPKISVKIQEDLSTAHYNLEQSLENFSQDRFNRGISNQRYVMTAANSMADYLSNLLNSMKNAAMKMGKGDGKAGGFSLPDIIKKQGALSDKMKEGMKKGKKPSQQEAEGEGGKKSGSSGAPGEKGKNGKSKGQGEMKGSGKKGSGDNEDLDGELYGIYKQQSKLRQQLEDAIREMGTTDPKGSGEAKRALKTMEQLENDILLLGFNKTTIQKMQQLNYELLKLEKAALEQGKENKRKSNTNTLEGQRNKKQALDFKTRFYNQIEILNRQTLPLQQNYKLKVRKYFSEPKKRE